MTVNNLLFSKDIISGTELRYKRLKIARYRRSAERIIYLYIRNKERRGLHGSSKLTEIHDN